MEAGVLVLVCGSWGGSGFPWEMMSVMVFPPANATISTLLLAFHLLLSTQHSQPLTSVFGPLLSEIGP